MKKLSLFIIASSISLCSFSQVVFQIISNSCDTNVIGNYAFTLSDTSDAWNTPDMNNPANAVQGCLVYINDGTPGNTNGANGTPPLFVPNYILGCDMSGNITQDLTNKIAVVYRSTCEFGGKAYNAQLRGAIGVIIINYDDDPIIINGGSYGLNVNIPVIILNRTDGDLISACLDTVCYGVEGFIGKYASTGISNALEKEKLRPYPNPTSNLLTIPIRQNAVGNVLVEVFDLAGKLVWSENKIISNEPLKVNVASIKNGAYLFNLTFTDGTNDKFKISVNR